MAGDQGVAGDVPVIVLHDRILLIIQINNIIDKVLFVCGWG
jgi:hypothetical protein